MNYEYRLCVARPTGDYELLDAGDGKKLERFGKVVLLRPDPQAIFPKKTNTKWSSADAEFVSSANGGTWKGLGNIEDISVTIDGITFILKFSSFKHTGVFPEQSENWSWLKNILRNRKKPARALNLFGYTGGASIAMAQEKTVVTHVDASRGALTSASANAHVSGLAGNEIRWIREDARSFVARELRRGNKYDAIIMDPPVFGHGAKGESWDIEKDLPKLIDDAVELLSDEPTLFLLNGYASGYTSLAYAQLLNVLEKKFGGKVERGELAIEATSGRILPAGIFARWSK